MLSTKCFSSMFGGSDMTRACDLESGGMSTEGMKYYTANA